MKYTMKSLQAGNLKRMARNTAQEVGRVTRKDRRQHLARMQKALAPLGFKVEKVRQGEAP